MSSATVIMISLGSLINNAGSNDAFPLLKKPTMETPFHKAKKNNGFCLIFITFKLICKVLRSEYQLGVGEQKEGKGSPA